MSSCISRHFFAGFRAPLIFAAAGIVAFAACTPNPVRRGGEVTPEPDADQPDSSGGGKGGSEVSPSRLDGGGGKEVSSGGISGQGGSVAPDASAEDLRLPVDQMVVVVPVDASPDLPPPPVDKAVPVDSPLPPPPPPDAAIVPKGALTVAFALNISPTPVDLTAEGTLDWAHFGLGTATAVTRKKGVPAQIMMTMSGGTAERYTDRPPRWSWTDGMPTMTGNSVPDGVFEPGDAGKFTITVPAGTAMRTLKIYCGNFEAQAKLTATLSDGSVPPKTDTNLSSTDVGKDAVYTIAFAAASEGQKLTVVWAVNASVNSESNVTMSAATLH